jgi:hypothetical protein
MSVVRFSLYAIAALPPLAAIIYAISTANITRKARYFSYRMLPIILATSLLLLIFAGCTMVSQHAGSSDWWSELLAKMLSEPTTFFCAGLIVTGLGIIVYGLITQKEEHREH